MMFRNLRPIFRPDTYEPDSSVIRLRPAWPADQLLDLNLYILPVSKTSPQNLWRQAPVLNRSGLVVGQAQSWQLNISAPAHFDRPDRNQSQYAHVVISRAGQREGRLIYLAAPITKVLPLTQNQTRRLLDKSSTGEEEKLEERKWVMHWASKLLIKTIMDRTEWPRTKLPREVGALMNLDRKTYLPIMHIDDQWLMNEHYSPLNESVEQLQIMVSWEPQGLGWYRFLLLMKQSFTLMDKLGGADGKDAESAQLKQMFAETSPWLLTLTMLVSIAHLLFDALAFHSDVTFWRGRDSFVGLSSSTLLLSFVSEAVILLYLLDNDSGLLILFGSIGSLLISGWKLTRIFRLSWHRHWPFFSLGTRPDQEQSTQSFDHQAIRALSYVLLPVVVLASIYSLLYKQHKGWYSWALSSFASAMYVGGFILMTPQLFVNYKLKSVAHLPWHTFIYRAMNTFIDDLFAFIIKMPTMHRLAVFRDDLVFFIFLYQRWIYPEDKTRKMD
eukprot:gb/GEZN01003340.1/.p1 GENE.gb/GEZN01003340.1/~~gb/GEZN01003340.1/.p1  ORF type:complete len:579 (-),score=76.14 gb/GEZN01003340.1/:467-1960(-)